MKKLYLILLIPVVCLLSAFVPGNHDYTTLEQRLQKQGLVDIAQIDSSIAVHLVYATPYNFMGKRLYHGLTHAFMLPQVAKGLVEAQKKLKAIRPDLCFIIYDAARPISIQYEMWNTVKDTDKRDFVADPTKGRGMHNYGIAVDLTLMDCTGYPLPMGSCYDYFGDESRVSLEPELLESGRITQREMNNRLLLRKVMEESGFKVDNAEWWHFNLVMPEQTRKELKVIE